MFKKYKNLSLSLLTTFICVTAFAESDDKLAKKSQDSANIIESAITSRDRGIPISLLNKAVCVATLPNVLRIGFVFGIRAGSGLVSCRTPNGWSQPSFIQLKGGSWGAQFGIESVDLVMVFVKSNAIEKFSQTNLTMGVDATVAAGPVGRDAQIGTDYQLNSEIYSYSKAKGFFAGLTIQGSVISINKGRNTQVYGQIDSNNLLVIDGMNSPEIVRPYVNALMTFAK